MDFGFLKRRKFSTLLVGFLLSAFGLFLFLHGTLSLRDAYRLSGAVDRVTGVVLRTNVRHGRSTSYYLDYFYRDRNVSVTVRSTQITREQWQVLQPGNTIPVRCLPDDPTVSEPDFSGEVRFTLTQAWFQIVPGLLFAGFGYYVALFSPKGKKSAARRESR